MIIRRDLVLGLSLFCLWMLFIVLHRRPAAKKNHIEEKSAISIYRLADKKSNGIIDPTCPWSVKHHIYVCSGYCPWVTMETTKCHFLPRIVHEDFRQNGMYCSPVVEDCLNHNAWLKEKLPLTMIPVRTISFDMLPNFTLNGLVNVNYNVGFQFLNYSGLGLNWSSSYIEAYRNQVRKREPFGTYYTVALYPVLEAYRQLAVRNKRCAVIGSQYPWIEAALLEFEAGNVTTVEYNRIVTDVPKLFTITPSAFATMQERDALTGHLKLFDSVWSYSSLEHDGLGRYTDPINPYGDLQTMVKISCMLKPGGLLFLAVPVNKYDGIHFNLHRVYGPVRLPILYRYFNLVQVFGQEIATDPNDYSRQPILVLQNKVGCA